MRLTIASRASALAVLQADEVARALLARDAALDIVRVTRSSEGDRDTRLALWAAEDKGLFTADLSRALVTHDVDLVVHSWKDLPIEPRDGTVVAGTLERADPRDVLLVRRDVTQARAPRLVVLSSSPRRGWQVESSLPRLLPWPVEEVTIAPVRGNIQTRLERLVTGDGDALVVAKAALDRLLSDDAPAAVSLEIRRLLDLCRWMVLPLKEHPTAPAQGALAVEVARDRPDVIDRVRLLTHVPTWRAVQRERAILHGLGGGCHSAVGATVLLRDYGEVTSVRAHLAGQVDRHIWSLATDTAPPPQVDASMIWPRPDERDGARRRTIDGVAPPSSPSDGWWIARADALPATWAVDEGRHIWTAGSRTWERLAARGVWVHGCADGLGDLESPRLDALAGRAIRWQRLTHDATGDPDAIATYTVERDLPGDLPARTHFFWMSGVLFLDALARYPEIAGRWHGSGPGRTARVIRDTLGPGSRHRVWLDYDEWQQAVTF